LEEPLGPRRLLRRWSFCLACGLARRALQPFAAAAWRTRSASLAWRCAQGARRASCPPTCVHPPRNTC